MYTLDIKIRCGPPWPSFLKVRGLQHVEVSAPKVKAKLLLLPTLPPTHTHTHTHTLQGRGVMLAGPFWILDTACITCWCPALVHLLSDLQREGSLDDSGHREISSGRLYGGLNVCC